MSINTLNHAWHTPVRGYQKLVLLALADYADEKGRCCPSLTDLSKKCGIGQSSVIVNLKRLIKMRLISKKRRCDDARHQLSNIYQLHLTRFSESNGDASCDRRVLLIEAIKAAQKIMADKQNKQNKQNKKNESEGTKLTEQEAAKQLFVSRLLRDLSQWVEQPKGFDRVSKDNE